MKSKKHLNFYAIKNLLTSTDIMVHFDPSKETELVTDASPSGLSAILIQNIPGSEDR